MALYVAVYDVHPGDRKHLERLLTRLSDARTNPEDILYIESFGSTDALYKTAQKYDLFIIDACEGFDGGSAGIAICDKLRLANISSPVAIYLPENTEPTTQNLLLAKSLGQIFFYNKSIKNEDLSSMIAEGKKHQFAKLPKIELRDATDTYFVLPDEILYAIMINSIMNITLSDGRCIRIIKDIYEFILDIDSYKQFIQVGKDKIVNLNHVTDKLSHALLVDDGSLISYSFFETGRINRLYEKHRK